jgi:glyoxylase-like metal-dependent hydrolase (beta-lactamase superfamily II)/rhodanese-related sulfurtransferase
MHVEQIYTGCLSQGAYYITSNGEAAIIDPLREVQPYLKRAERDGVEIKYIFETHFHADFVSGHLTLAERTGAPIVFGPNATTDFDAIIAEHGQVFKLGNVEIIALHTPGHTLESTTYLLRDEEGRDHAIFTGDTLFLGDVGRPDLAQKIGKITTSDLAGMLFDSLRTHIMPLADDVTVYPAHGAGSACGKKMMKETVDTLGNQKKVNYALRDDMTRDEFIREVTDGLSQPPSYFPANVYLNKNGYDHIDVVIDRATVPLAPADFKAAAANALVLDVRDRDAFVQSHVPSSIFIGLDGSFAPWVGELLVDVHQSILLVVHPDQLEEAITRLSRVGFDNVIGYLDGGVNAWSAAGLEVDTVPTISPQDAWSQIEAGARVVDVRKCSEYEGDHIKDAIHAPLSELNDYISTFAEGPTVIHCASGYRSVIAASILKARGIHDLTNVAQGIKGLRAHEVSVSP